MKSVLPLCLLAVALFAQDTPQPQPLLGNQQALDLFTRAVQLMESATIAVPDLARPGAPLIENARQSIAKLRLQPGNAEQTYAFLSNLRGWLALADSVPKPFPFPDQAQKQFSELRDSAARIDIHFRALVALKDRQLRNSDRDNLARYAEANGRQAPPKPGKQRVVFLGDSITDAWRFNEYFPDRDFVNRGISGQITGQMLGRMQADVVDLHPDAVLILAGTNDLDRGVPVSAIENNLAMIADIAEYNKIKVILASVLPVSDYHKDVNPAYERTPTRQPFAILTLNRWIQGLCNQRGYTYLDYSSAMMDGSGFLRADISDDGLHPNANGYRVMAPLALAAVDAALKAPAPQTKARRRGLFGR
jgi:lysophospholipase L1-like esterase